MSVASELLDRLRRHYLPAGPMPGGIFLTECGLNGGRAGLRRVDAVYVGFTSASGRILKGHEVKVTRADWLHELAQIDKADVWSDQCHEWYLVVPDPAIVHDGELPAGWGLMVPDPKAKVRFKTVVPAARKDPDTHQPSWLIVRSIMARLDTLQQQERGRFERDLRPKVEQDVRSRLARSTGPVMAHADQVRVNAVAGLEKALGVSFTKWADPDALLVSPGELAEALAIVRARSRLVDRWDGLATTARALRDHAQLVDELAQTLAGEAV